MEDLEEILLFQVLHQLEVEAVETMTQQLVMALDHPVVLEEELEELEETKTEVTEILHL
jgi:uncharacterized protein (DUF1778 family)